MHKNESGRSMIEMLGVLAIIGVLSVGGIAGYSRAMTKYRTNKTIDQVSMLVTNIRTLFAQQNNFEGLSNYGAYELGVIPDDLVPNGFANTATGALLKNAFKGNVFINPVPATADDATADLTSTAFEIAFDGLSREACISMATSDWGSGSASGLVSVVFGGKASGAAVNTRTGATISAITNRYVGCAGEPAEGTINTSAETADGVAVACPNGDYRLPLSVADASKACNCVGKSANQCSITWIYF